MEEANRPFGVMPPIVRDEDVDENGVLLEYENDLLKDRDLLDYVEKFIASKEGYPEYYRAVLQDIFSNPSLGMYGIFFMLMKLLIMSFITFTQLLARFGWKIQSLAPLLLKLPESV